MGRHSNPGSTASLETRIMDLWESGVPHQQIHRHLGVNARSVRRIFSYMSDSGEHARHRRAMAQGSTRLLQAIRAARPEGIAHA